MSEPNPFRVNTRGLKRLLAIPHVVGFEVSPRQAADADLIITVYVSKKFREGELEKSQRVPAELGGVPIRVRERGS